MNIAKSYLSKGVTLMRSLQPRATENLEYSTPTPDTNATKNYYVFNIAGNKGFIIVSGDTRVRKVLGYSKTGSFNPNSVPEPMKEWLQGYDKEIQYAVQNIPDQDVAVVPSLKSLRITQTVDPLLRNIAYGQLEPFNEFSPIVNGSKTPTGCGATAMSMIMKYYNWPNRAVGSKTYTTQTKNLPLSVDFSTTQYKWDIISDNYTNPTTDAQKTAIAQVMYHAGVSIEMDFRPNGSSSIAYNIPPAMFTNFGYDAGIQYYDRNYWKDADWRNKIITELNAKRPVLYRGTTSDYDGHIFVCDGYDANGLFHFNWGWDGTSNGYFELSALNPKDMESGTGNVGYNFDQGMITGIQPAIKGSVHKHFIGMDNISFTTKSIGRNDYTTLNINGFSNPGAFEYPQSDWGIALVLTQNGIVKDTLVKQISPFGISPGATFGGPLKYTIRIDPTIPNGEYLISALYKNEKNQFVPLLVSNTGSESLKATVTNNAVTFSQSPNQTNLSLVKAPVATTNLYQNKTGQFEINIKNNGQNDYYAQLGVSLVSQNNPSVKQDVVNSVVSIPAGATKVLRLWNTITVNPGTYNIQVSYDTTNSQDNPDFPVTLSGPSNFKGVVNVYATPTTEPALTVNNQTIQIPSVITKGTQFTYTADITNTGGMFDKSVMVSILNTNSNTPVSSFGQQLQPIDHNQTKTLNFTGVLSDLPAGNYRAAISYWMGAYWMILPGYKTFTLNENYTSNALTETDQFRIKEIPVQTELKADVPADINYLNIYNMDGKPLKKLQIVNEKTISVPVGEFSPGVYVLQAVFVDGKTKSIKFIKK